MKNCPSVFRTALATITATAMCAGVCFAASPNQSNSTTTSVGSSTVAGSAVSSDNALPYDAQEVVKMYKGGISKDVILSYINSSTLPYQLSAANLAYLQSAGVPQDITQAMIQRGDDAREQQALQATMAQAPVATNGAVTLPTPGESVTPPTPPPTVLAGPDYGYYYPDYDYDLYAPPIIVGGGWGWGYHGWHGGHGDWGHHGGGFGHSGFHGGFHGGGHGGGGRR
jgi:uncharacterized membrane protein YgcG